MTDDPTSPPWSRRAVTPHDRAGVLRRAMRTAAATAPVSRVYAPTLHWLDKGVHRVTGGRTTFAALVTGLPVVLLTTTGARSGAPRTWPLLGVPVGDQLAVIASNWGAHRHPAWYHNLRANPRAIVVVDGVEVPVRAREVEGEERDRLWRTGV
jgi:deazaflavin-dependent oxidoreductase (nitroreductase family)